MSIDNLKAFDCGGTCTIAAETIEQARQLYDDQYGGQPEDEICEVSLDAVTAFVDGECGEPLTFESITFRDLIAYQASRGRKFPDAVCFSGEYC